MTALAGRLVFVVGGARSGKSKYAVERAKGEAPSGKVAFVATAVPGKDEEMLLRVEEHKKARPKGWETLEEPFEPDKLVLELSPSFEAVVLDCLTLWLFNWFERLKGGGQPLDLRRALEKRVKKAATYLRAAANNGKVTLIVVSNEVGMGVVPPDPFDRVFCDVLGRLNQLVALEADEVILVCCGIPTRIKP